MFAIRRLGCVVSPFAIVACALISVSASAQDAGTTTLTIGAQLVVIDVNVTDASGKVVDDLTQKDFQVFEDGKLQRLRSVEPPTAHTLPAQSEQEGSAAVFDPAQPTSFGRSPVSILVLDQLNTHFSDSSFARRSLHDYLAAQPKLLKQPTTLLTLSDASFKTLAVFTRDRDTLLKALASAPVKYDWKLELNGKTEFGPIERLDQTLRSMEQIAQSFARIAGRKNLIWVGGGYPTIDPTLIDRGDAQAVKDALQHVTDVLLQTHVTVYAVDPTSNAAHMTEITDEQQQAFADAAGDSLAGGTDPFDTGEDFDSLGPVTGGRVLRNMNDVAHQIAVSVDLGTNFYTLAYTPSTVTDTAVKFRKITVVCTRPGLTLSSRSGYYVGKSVRQKSEDAAIYDLSTAAESTIPLNGLKIAVELDRDANAPANTYLIQANVGGLSWTMKTDGSSVASVYIMAVSLDAKNKPLGQTVHPMLANARPGADLKDPKTAVFTFNAAPVVKASTLRFVVRDSATGRMGSVDLPLGKH